MDEVKFQEYQNKFEPAETSEDSCFESGYLTTDISSLTVTFLATVGEDEDAVSEVTQEPVYTPPFSTMCRQISFITLLI